jgi:hypothetical protein
MLPVIRKYTYAERPAVSDGVPLKEEDAPVFIRSMRSSDGGGADHGAPIAAAKVEKLRLAAAGPQ